MTREEARSVCLTCLETLIEEAHDLDLSVATFVSYDDDGDLNTR